MKRAWKHQTLDLDEVLQDSPKCRDHMRRIEEGMDEFTLKLKRMIKFAKQIQAASTQLSTSYNQFAAEMITLGPEVQNANIRDGFERFANSIKALSNSRLNLSEQIGDLFVVPAEEFIKNDVEGVRARRKNYDRANNSYTNALSKLSNLKKKEARDNTLKTHEVEHELNDTKRDYRIESLNFAFALNDMQAKKHYSVLENSISFCFAQCDYYKDAWNLCGDLNKFMKDLKTHLRVDEAEILEEKTEVENYKIKLTQTPTTSHTYLRMQKPAKSTALTIQGYLFKKNASAMVGGGWQRRYFVVEDGKLLYYKTGKETTPVAAVELLLCSVKEKLDIDRRFCFEIISPDKLFQLQAEDEEKMKEWITVLQNATASLLNMQAPARPVEKENSKMSAAMERESIEEEKKHETALQQVRDHDPANRVCVDCSAPNPEWGSINLGVLICIDCSGPHRSMGVHISKVRSFTLDKWDPENIKYMLALGNEKMNRIFEETLQKEMKITSD